ncbi:MAG: VOC family protein [Desulfovibrionaceae bacterium]
MVLGIRHTGIVVTDLRRAAAFYAETFGFAEVSSARERGGFIEGLVGLTNVELTWVKMTAEDGSLLELLQYHSPRSPERPGLQEANALGCSHVAFTVDDLEATLDRVQGHGGDKGTGVQASPDGKVLVAYARDPEGNILELVEERRTENNIPHSNEQTTMGDI